MIINSIKNNLNIVLHSTAAFTRCKIEKIAKIIFESSCNLLRCIRDNPKITLAFSAIALSVGAKARIASLSIMGVALVGLTSLFIGVKHATSKEIVRLDKEINRLDAEIDKQISCYNKFVTSGEYTQEDLSVYHESCELACDRNRAEIENHQIEIDQLRNLQNW